MSSGVAPPDGSPARLSALIAGCLAGVGWSVAVPYSLHATAVASIGWLLVGLALLAGDRRVLTAGAAALALGTVAAAGVGAPLSAALVGAAAAVLAWDVGQNAIGIGRQLGRAATTARAELVHVFASLAAGGCIVAVGYVAAAVSRGGRPIIAVVFLLLAAGLVAVALGPRAALEFEFPE